MFVAPRGRPLPGVVEIEHSRTTHPLESREHVAEIGRLGPVVAAWAYGAIEHSSTSSAATIPVHVYL